MFDMRENPSYATGAKYIRGTYSYFGIVLINRGSEFLTWRYERWCKGIGNKIDKTMLIYINKIWTKPVGSMGSNLEFYWPLPGYAVDPTFVSRYPLDLNLWEDLRRLLHNRDPGRQINRERGGGWYIMKTVGIIIKDKTSFLIPFLVKYWKPLAAANSWLKLKTKIKNNTNHSVN